MIKASERKLGVYEKYVIKPILNNSKSKSDLSDEIVNKKPKIDKPIIKEQLNKKKSSKKKQSKKKQSKDKSKVDKPKVDKPKKEKEKKVEVIKEIMEDSGDRLDFIKREVDNIKLKYNYDKIVHKCGYIIKKNTLDNKMRDMVFNDLNVKPNQNQTDDVEVESYPIYVEYKDVWVMPIFYGLEKFGKPDVDLIEYEENRMVFIGEMREKQVKILDMAMDYIGKNRGGILCAGCGDGKTVLGIKIACELKAKTLVLVHKSFLLEQWVKRIKQFSDAKIGILRQSKIPDTDCDIIVGMVQSITMKNYNPEIFKKLKLVIVDECHHYASKTFSQVFYKCNAPFMLGLSATPYRKDKTTDVIFWNIGKIFYKPVVKINRQVICKSFIFHSNDKNFKEKMRWIKGAKRPDHVGMISRFIELPDRNNHIINILNEIRKHPERKILVLSARIKHLETLKSAIDELIGMDIEKGILEPMEYKTSFYIGAMNAKERVYAEENADIFFGTYDMAQEGLDIDGLNTIVLATSQKDVIQAVGRTTRKILKNGDIRPLVIEINDDTSIYKNQSRVRQEYYIKSKYKIEKYYLENDKIISLEKHLEKTIDKDEIKNHILDEELTSYNTNYADILDLQRVMDEDEIDNDNNVCSGIVDVVEDDEKEMEMEIEMDLRKDIDEYAF